MASANADAPTRGGHNPDLLTLMPRTARYLIETGCNTGALAQAYKAINPACRYRGIEINPDFAQAAASICDSVDNIDIEITDDAFFDEARACDCWVFGDVLEHLRDPWRVLHRIRAVIAADGCVVACIPNLQHWSLQARLSFGDFRYEQFGLLDRTHLRWFTRATILEMFTAAGFTVAQIYPRIFSEPMSEAILPIIRTMAERCGADPESAVRDARPLQYVIRAIPAQDVRL